MYALVLLVVIGLILTMASSALAAPANLTALAGAAGPAPFGSAAEPPTVTDSGSVTSSGTPHADQSSRPAPVVVLGTDNLTWADIQARAADTADTGANAADVGSAAAHLLAFASTNEAVNLAVRTPADRTCPTDGWLTLGKGARASAIEPAASCAGPTAAIPNDASPLVRALGRDVSIRTVGPGTQLTTGTPGSSPDTDVSLTPSLPEALSSGADLTIIDTGRDISTDAERITALDAALRTVQEQARPGTRIVIASVADNEDPGPQIAVLPSGTTSARGTSGGLIVGTSTHQPGLAQLTDLAPTLTTALTGHSDPAFDGQALDLPASGSTTSTTDLATAHDTAHISWLAYDALHARASQRTVIPAGVLLMGSTAVLLAWAAAVLRETRAERRKVVRRRVTRVAICLSALPTALLLVNAIPWWSAGARGDSPSAWVPGAAFTMTAAIAIGVLALAAGIMTPVHRWYTRSAASSAPSSNARATAPRRGGTADPVPSPPSRTTLLALLVAAAIPLAWLADAAAGAHLAFNNPLGMNAVVAGRFYGVSNTAFALAAGALVVVIAGAWDALGRSRSTALVLTGLLGGAALVVDGAPQLGADVGGALTLVPTLAFLGAGLAGLRLNWRHWLVIGATTVLVVGGFAVVDLIRPGGPTHLGRFARQVADGSAIGVLGRKAYALVGPFVSKPVMAAALACTLALVVVAVWWGRGQVRAWHAGTSPYAWLAPATGGGTTTALRALGVLTVASVLVNDSGVTMAGFIFAAAAPALLALTLNRSNSAPLPHDSSLPDPARAQYRGNAHDDGPGSPRKAHTARQSPATSGASASESPAS